MQVAGEAPAPQPSSSKAVQRFFAFICVSTLCRAFEAGICASMMPKIADSLRLSYVQEGVVASAPDYGIVPAGFLAILLFERVDAYPVLVVGNLLIGAVALWCAAFPSYGSLVTARAVGGLAWGCSMVHYPAWINAKGPAASKTGQEKRAKFPTSKAPSSAVFHSFRLIFGRAIISRNGLEAWMLLLERARAEHSR